MLPINRLDMNNIELDDIKRYIYIDSEIREFIYSKTNHYVEDIGDISISILKNCISFENYGGEEIKLKLSEFLNRYEKLR